MNEMNEMKFKSQIIDGVEVLLIKWQDDDERPAIRMMAYVGGIYAEATIGFDDFEKRDNYYDNLTELVAGDFVELAKSASRG